MKNALLLLILLIFTIEGLAIAGTIGDINADGDIDLSDVISSLQVMTNNPGQNVISLTGDVNSDNKIGMAELLYGLSYLAGLRETATSGFTAAMLDASPTYYVTFSGDPDGTTDQGTTQEILVFSGTGPYVVTVTTEYFDASGVSQGQNSGQADVTLNANGTLTGLVSGEPGATIITLTAVTDTYLLVNGVVNGGSETWDEYWFFAKPEGWLDQLDFDNDGDSYTENQGDCNDTDPMTNPNALDFCGDGIDQDCNGSDLECLPSEFYGGWQLYDNSADEFISFTIFNDGVYMYGEKDASGTENGVEVGTLGINLDTDVITVHTVYDQASSGGIDDTPNNIPSDHTMTVSGDTLTFTEPGNPDSPFTLTRVTDTSEPLIGSWHFGSAGHKEDIINSMTAYDNNTYIYCEYNIKTPQDSGVEFGTYAYATGEIILTTVVDQNGDAGTSGISGLTLPLVVNGDEMTLSLPDETPLTFYRVE